MSESSKISARFMPCPLCGAVPTVMTREFFKKLDRNNNGAVLEVECRRCSLTLRNFPHDLPGGIAHDYDKRIELLVEKWNRLGAEVESK